MKWVADPLFDGLSTGVVWAVSFDVHRSGRPSHTLYVPVTWSLADNLAVHANVGADRSGAGTRTRRIGLSGEWSANDKLSLIAERVKFPGDWTSRLGCRLNLSDSISLDVSVARTGPRAATAHGFGFNHDFVR